MEPGGGSGDVVDGIWELGTGTFGAGVELGTASLSSGELGGGRFEFKEAELS